MPQRYRTIDEYMSAFGSGQGAGFDAGVTDVSLGNNPHFQAIDVGDGQFSSGSGTGADFMDWNAAGAGQFVRPAEGSGDNQTSATFDSAGFSNWLTTNNYRLREGRLGGNSGLVRWIEDANGQLIGQPTYLRNTAVSDRNAQIAVLMMAAGGQAAFGGSGAEAGAAAVGTDASAGSMAAADSVYAGTSAADITAAEAAAGGTAGGTAGGYAGDATAAGYDPGVTGVEASSGGYSGDPTAGGYDPGYTGTEGGSPSGTGGSEFNESGFDGREPTNPNFAQSGRYGNYNAGGSGGYNWDQIIRGGLGLWEAYRMRRDSRDGGTSPASRAANEELTRLLEDPSRIQDYPGYAAGIQAVERAGAGGGYLGSGNMMVALQQYGGDFYDRALQRLSGIVVPAERTAAAMRLASTQLYGQALNSLGYGLSGNGSGGNNDYYSALVALLGDE